MPYPSSQTKRVGVQCLLCAAYLFICSSSIAQVRWTGSTGDGQWTTAANWAGNQVPAASDDVVLDNNVVAGNYKVLLPGLSGTVTIRSIIITPSAGDSIQLVLPASNTAAPAFTATGAGYGITINDGGVLLNSSGSSSVAAIAVTDSIKINNGGQYTHNTRSSHAVLVSVLSGQPGTEKGIFKFDVPGGGYTFASTNRNYGTLVLSAQASGGVQSYATTAASPFTINGDFIIETGVTVNLNVTAATVIKGDYIQQGGVFNLASQPHNNIVYVRGRFMQSGGSITETSTGLPVIELNGNLNQPVQASGTITNSVGITINNNAGVTLLTDLSLPYKLSLQHGIISTNGLLLTLLTGCSLQADSTTNASFVNGRVRKEGLSAASNFLFPVGKGTAQRWVALKDVTGNFNVEYFKANPATLSGVDGTGINHISAIEYWSIDADAAPAAAASAELSFDNVNSGGVTDMNSLRVAQLVSGEWTDKGNTVSTGTAGGAGAVTSNALNTFASTARYFTLASSNAQNPLPIALVSFSSSFDNNGVAVRWAISASLQLAAFELQYAADGAHFTFLSSIPAVSNQYTYLYTDSRVISGQRYYRLKLIDQDGSVFYSDTHTAAANGIAATIVQVRPSVITNQAQLFINSPAGMQVQMAIYDAAGRTVYAAPFQLQLGINTFPLQLQHLPAGLYTAAVTAAQHTFTAARFIKRE